jgi:lysophospholipase L1-like esterase
MARSRYPRVFGSSSAKARSRAAFVATDATPTPTPTPTPAFRAYNGTVIGFGDSRVQALHNDYPANRNLSSRNFLGIARALSGDRINYNGLNFGVAGNTTAQMLARLPDVITAAKAANARYVVVRGGFNSIAAGLSAATAFADIQSICDALIAQQIQPIPVLDTGAGINPSSGQPYLNEAAGAQLNQFNVLLQAYADSKGIPAFDPRPAVLSSAPGVYPFVFKSGHSEDNLHPNLRGARAEGVALWAFMQPLIGTAPSLRFTGADVLANPTLATTTGGTLGTGATGTVPAGYTATAREAAGATAVISTNLRTDGRREIVMQITTGTTPPTFLAQQAFSLEQATLAGIGMGDVFEGGAEITIDAGATGLTGVSAFARFIGPNAGFVIQYDTFPDVNGAFGTVEGDLTFTSRAAPVVVTEAPTSAGWFCRAYFGAAGSATVRIIPFAKKA